MKGPRSHCDGMYSSFIFISLCPTNPHYLWYFVFFFFRAYICLIYLLGVNEYDITKSLLLAHLGCGFLSFLSCHTYSNLDKEVQIMFTICAYSLSNSSPKVVIISRLMCTCSRMLPVAIAGLQSHFFFFLFSFFLYDFGHTSISCVFRVTSQRLFIVRMGVFNCDNEYNGPGYSCMGPYAKKLAIGQD